MLSTKNKFTKENYMETQLEQKQDFSNTQSELTQSDTGYSIESKASIWLGKRVFGDPMEFDIPREYNFNCTAEEMYAAPADRVIAQPLFHPAHVGNHKAMKRALFVDTLRRKISETIANKSIPFTLACWMLFVLIFSFSSGSSDIQTNEKPTVVGALISNIKAKFNLEYEMAKSKVVNSTKSRDDLTLDAIQMQQDAVKYRERYQQGDEEAKKQLMALDMKYKAIHGDALIGMREMKSKADELTQKFNSGSITQDEYNKQRTEMEAKYNQYKKELE